MRQFGKTLLRRWDDPDWISLSHTAQWLYDAFVSSSKLSGVGAIEWRPKQFAKLSSAMTLDLLDAAFDELRQGLYIVFDESVDQVLVRSYVRNDVFGNKNMTIAAVKAWRQLGSIELKRVAVFEFLRLREDFPTAPIWEHEDMIQTLKTPPLDPKEYVAETWPGYLGMAPVF